MLNQFGSLPATFGKNCISPTVSPVRRAHRRPALLIETGARVFIEALEARLCFAAGFDHLVQHLAPRRIALGGAPRDWLDVEQAFELKDGSSLVLLYSGTYSDDRTSNPLTSFAKITRAGELDPTFGVGGVTSWPNINFSYDFHFIQRADGGFYLADTVTVWDEITETPIGDRIEVRRFDSAGHLDNAYGTAGLAEFDLAARLGATVTDDTLDGLAGIRMRDDGSLHLVTYLDQGRCTIDVTPNGTFLANAATIATLPSTTIIDGVAYDVTSGVVLPDGRDVLLADPVVPAAGERKITVVAASDFTSGTGVHWFTRPRAFSTVTTASRMDADGGIVLSTWDGFFGRLTGDRGMDTSFGDVGDGLVSNRASVQATDDAQEEAGIQLRATLVHGVVSNGASLHNLYLVASTLAEPTMLFDTTYSPDGVALRQDTWLFDAIKPGRIPNSFTMLEAAVMRRADGTAVAFMQAPDNQSIYLFDPTLASPAPVVTPVLNPLAEPIDTPAPPPEIETATPQKITPAGPMSSLTPAPLPRSRADVISTLSSLQSEPTSRIALSLFDLRDDAMF